MPHFNKHANEKITIGLNHADIARSGNGWNNETGRPNNELVSYLQNKISSVGKRLQTSTGLTFVPHYFCSGFCDEFGLLKPYQIETLLTKVLASHSVVPVSIWQRAMQWFYQRYQRIITS